MGRVGDGVIPIDGRRDGRWMLVADVDGTLLGDSRELRALLAKLDASGVVVVPNSSRPLASLAASWAALGLGTWAAQVGALGTEVEIGGSLTSWGAAFSDFNRRDVDDVIGALGYVDNGDEFQTRLKASYRVPRQAWPAVSEAVLSVVDAQIVTSGDYDLDVIPAKAGKASPLAYLCDQLGVDWDRVVAAGDSMNDLQLLKAATEAIVVGNADPELVDSMEGRATVARAHFAAGVMEGLGMLGVLT